MIDFTESKIGVSIMHYIGNKANGENLILSNDIIQITDETIHKKLLNFFIKPFQKNEDFHQFSHVTDLELNECYNYSLKVFQDNSNFDESSSKIAKHLYKCTIHPKIRPGELMIAYIENLTINDRTSDALVLLKIESKDTVFNVIDEHDSFNVKAILGISDANVEKACLIFNSDSADGFNILSSDSKGSSEETVYWKDQFLEIKPISDNYHQTTDYLKICKSFITERLTDDFSVSKTDKIDYLNKSITYFKEEELFEEKDFIKKVFENKPQAKSFLEYKDEISMKNEIPPESFPISANAVKKQDRIFKSVLKLDKNFHLYIHGDKNLIEKGFDNETGMYFYKIFFKEEN